MLKKLLELKGVEMLQKDQLSSIMGGANASLEKMADAGEAGCNADEGCPDGCSHLDPRGFLVCSTCCIA